MAARFADLDTAGRAAVLDHPRCPPSLAYLASGDSDRFLRNIAAGSAAWSGRVAAHPGAPRGALSDAAAAPDAGRRRDAAAHPAAAAAALARLAADDDTTVRARAAINQRSSPAILGALAAQTDEHVLAVHALSNPRCDRGALYRVGRVLARNVKGRLLSTNTDHTMLAAALAHPCADARLLDDLAGPGAYHEDLRLAVANNAQAGPGLLQRLSRDPAAAVRAAVADAPGCDDETRRRLASDRDDVVRRHVAAHPATPGAAPTDHARTSASSAALSMLWRCCREVIQNGWPPLSCRTLHAAPRCYTV